MKKRLVAFIMAFAMVLTMVPIVALAEDLPEIDIFNPTIQVLEGTNGYMDCETQGKEYFRYYIDQCFDVDTVDGLRQVPANTEFQYGDYTYQITMNENQSFENQWTAGNIYTIDVILQIFDFSEGYFVDVPGYVPLQFTYEVLENPLESYVINDASLIMYTGSGGKYVFESDGSFWFKYNENCIPFDIVSINPDGNGLSIYKDIYESGVQYKDTLYRPTLAFEQDIDHQIEKGSHTYPTELMNVDGTITIDVKEPTINDRIEKVVVEDVTVEYGSSVIREFDGDNLVFNISPSYTVYYKDGTKGYGVAEPWSSYHDSKDNVDYAVGVYIDGQNEIDYVNGEDFAWDANSTHKAYVVLAGKKYDFSIKVADAIESIEVIGEFKVPRRTDNDYGQYISDNLSDYLSELQLKVNYSDGSYKYDSIETQGYNSNYNQELDELELVVINPTYGPITIPTKIVENHIESIEIDESTIGKAYWAKSPWSEEYSYDYSPVGTNAIVTFDDGTTFTITSDNSTIEYDGVKYNVSILSKEESDKLYVFAQCGELTSDDVEVPLVDKSVTVESVEVIQEPTVKYYINDAFYKVATLDDEGLFEPIEFTGLVVRVTMTNGDVIDIDASDLTTRDETTGETAFTFGSDFNHHSMFIESFNRTEDSCDLQMMIFGEYHDLGITIQKEESPYKSISLVSRLSAEQLENFDATGLQFKIEYNDGREPKIVTLGAPVPSENGQYVCDMYFNRGEGGDGFELFGFDDSVSGLRMNAYYLGNDEYASIIWNNEMLRVCDQLISINPEKYFSTNGSASDVDIDIVALSNAVIGSLSEEDRYTVEQQGSFLFDSVNVDEVEATKNILVKANNDDSEIKDCYDINFSYEVNGGQYQLTELPNGKIAVTVPLDESLWGLSKDEIVIYREHQYADGVKVEQITDFTISDDGKFITFESDKFSTFALGYKEADEPTGGNNGGNKQNNSVAPNEEETIAKTLDETPIAATVALLWSSGLCVYAVNKKRKET